MQWLAAATYPKPPGLTQTKSRLDARFQKLRVYGQALASARHYRRPRNDSFTSGGVAGEDALAQLRGQLCLFAGGVDHQDQRRAPERAEPVAPHRVFHLEAGTAEPNCSGGDQDLVGVN